LQPKTYKKYSFDLEFIVATPDGLVEEAKINRRPNRSLGVPAASAVANEDVHGLSAVMSLAG
jgi:hypothetical protein